MQQPYQLQRSASKASLHMIIRLIFCKDYKFHVEFTYQFLWEKQEQIKRNQVFQNAKEVTQLLLSNLL